MKTLVVCNQQGKLVFTQTNAIEEYICLVEDIENNKEVIGVDLAINKFILADKQATTEEKEQLKIELEAKNIELDKKNKELEIKNQNLENKELESLKLTDKVIELTAKNLINQ